MPEPRVVARCIARYIGGPYDGMTVWVDLRTVDDIEDAKLSFKNKTTMEVRDADGVIHRVKAITGCTAVLYYED